MKTFFQYLITAVIMVVILIIVATIEVYAMHYLGVSVTTMVIGALIMQRYFDVKDWLFKKSNRLGQYENTKN
jgi:hypothetical protein